MTSEVGDAIRELAHVVKTEDEIEGIALQVDDLWNRAQAQRVATADGWDLLLVAATQSAIAAEEASKFAQKAQIATQEPAGEPGAGSAGRGASGGLGGRLRAAADYQDRPGAYDELRAMADEADEVEAAYRVADAEIARLSEFHDHYRAQVERVRRAVTEAAWIFQDPTDSERQMLDAFEVLIEQALDGPKPETATNENEGA